jgi:hypothetical protein
MSRLRVKAVLFAAVLATAIAGAVGMPASGSAYAPIAAPTAAAKPCASRFVHARLSWGHKCLAAGQFCKVGNREYLRYGFYCPRSGHLRRR